jgi:hypothetical protein
MNPLNPCQVIEKWNFLVLRPMGINKGKRFEIFPVKSPVPGEEAVGLDQGMTADKEIGNYALG